MNGDDDLTNSHIPLKWVFGGIAWLISASGFAATLIYNLGVYQAATDAKIETLQATDAAQIAALAKIPDRLTRMEMILCSTDDGARKAQCDRLSVN